LVSCEGYGSVGTCDGDGVNPLGVSCCYLYWGWSSIGEGVIRRVPWGAAWKTGEEC